MLNFSLVRRTPVILQTEAAECGLACLAMVAAHHGHQVDLATLRGRCSVSLKGSTLADLMRWAGALQLTPRPLRLDLEDLDKLKLPCLLHWDFGHFVVMEQIRGSRLMIHDPAIGRRELSLKELSKHFTGVVLELTPTPAFQPQVERQRLQIGSLVRTTGNTRSIVGQILALAMVLQVFAIIAPFHMQWIVDQALVALDRDMVAVIGIGFLLLAVIQTGVAALRSWLIAVLGTMLSLESSARLFRHMVRLPINWFGKRHTGDVLSKFDSLDTIQRTLTTSFIEALIDGVMALATLAMMLLYSPRLTLVALTAAVLFATLRLALYQPLRLATEEQIAHGGRRHSHFLESVRGVQCIKLFGREEQRATGWHNLLVDELNAGVRVQRLGVIYQTLNGLLFGVENVVTIWLGALLVLDARGGAGFSVGMLFAFVSYKSQFVQRAAALVEKGLQLRMLSLHTARVADIVLCAPEQDPNETFEESIGEGGCALELKGVSFRYADADPLVLDAIDVRIEQGESVAIVGSSGCGKTTLVKLMLGLLQPTSGCMEVGGQLLSQPNVTRYRRLVASVMQDDQLFAGSIGDNICFFDSAPDLTKIEECSRLAAIHGDIAAMPMKYNTLVGDMGTVLSGGQKQRILLARALYRDPKILFLDEATSHLDVALERSVNAAVRGLQLTRIVVAHRPETIASADRVICLSDGRLHSPSSAARWPAVA